MRLGISFTFMKESLKKIIRKKSYDLVNMRVFFVVPVHGLGHTRPKT